MSLATIVGLTVVFVLGAALLPVAIYVAYPLFPGFVRSMLGSLHWTAVAIALKCYAIVQEPHSYRLKPVKRGTGADVAAEHADEFADDETVWFVKDADGEWQPIKHATDRRERLGLGWAVLVWDKTAATLSDVRPTATDDGAAPAPDGGQTRPRISLQRYYDQIRRMADQSLARAAAKEAEKEYGGSTSALHGKTYLALIGFALLCGIGAGYLAF